MSAAYDIGTKLASLGYGAVGTVIGVNAFMDKADNEIAVFGFPGDQDDMTFGGNVAFEYPNVQIQVRNTSNQTSESTCRSIYVALRGLMDQTLNGHEYQHFEPKREPIKLDVDEKERTTWMCELKLHRRPE